MQIWIDVPVDAVAGDVVELPDGRRYVVGPGEAGTSVPLDRFWRPAPVAAE